jgi:hypothetical protein
MKSFFSLQEDLRKWFSKTDPAGDWKRINSKGEAIGPCAREPGEPKPKCMSRAKRESLTKKERASAVRAKRKHDPNPERKGEPINVSNFGKGKISENMENLNEKNVPTNPSLWSQAKSLARSKFDVYPSAYANGWASKWYKSKGGSWKSVSEAVKDKYDEGEYDQEGDMAKSDLRSIIANAQKMHDMIDDADNLPEWVQSKITLAEDYISTVANYMMSELDEEVESLRETRGAQAMKSSGVKQSQDKLLARTGMNLPHKFPRTGQTNLGNIPGINTPNVSKDTADYAEKRRGDRAKQLKPAIKAALGTHGPKGKLPEEVEPITELSADTLDRYKEKAKKSSDSLTSQGKYRQANDRTMNVMKATGKQIDKTVANIRKSLNNDATPAQRSLQPNNKTMVRESRRLEIVREAMTDAKKKDQKKKIEKKVEMNGSDKFQSDPELSSQVIKNNV